MVFMPSLRSTGDRGRIASPRAYSEIRFIAKKGNDGHRIGKGVDHGHDMVVINGLSLHFFFWSIWYKSDMALIKKLQKHDSRARINHLMLP